MITMKPFFIKSIWVALLLASPFVVLGQTGNFETVKVADGIYAAIRKEPHGLTTNANSVFIINDVDVIVVDTTLTPGTATELLAALRKLTDKPVRYVINTHWHDDHIMGNQVFRDAFPAADFIAHARTLEYLPVTGLENRKRALSEQGYPQFIKALRSRLEKGESRPGVPLNDEERTTLSSDIKIAEAYMKENPTARIILPTMTVEDKLTIHRGESDRRHRLSRARTHQRRRRGPSSKGRSCHYRRLSYLARTLRWRSAIASGRLEHESRKVNCAKS